MPRRKTNLQVIENLNSDIQQVKRKSTLKMRIEDLITIDALTETQGHFFAEYKKDCKAMLLHGCAGTGKHILPCTEHWKRFYNEETHIKK